MSRSYPRYHTAHVVDQCSEVCTLSYVLDHLWDSSGKEVVFVVGNLGKAWWSIYKAAPISHVKESMTQISGWNEPLETDTKRTKKRFSRCMNPSPIFQRLSADPSIGYPWDLVMSDNERGFSTLCEPTVIDSRYWFSFLAISYASLLRVIRVRVFVQPKVEICHPSQHATT